MLLSLSDTFICSWSRHGAYKHAVKALHFRLIYYVMTDFCFILSNLNQDQMISILCSQLFFLSVFLPHAGEPSTCHSSTCCLSVSTLVQPPLLGNTRLRSDKTEEEWHCCILLFHQWIKLHPRACGGDRNMTVLAMGCVPVCLYVCVCVCVCVCAHMLFPSTPRGCPSCQSCSVCTALWTEACSGRNLGRHSAPLKSFAQTRHSGTKARVHRNTWACAVAWACVTEWVGVTDRGEKKWYVQSLALLFWRTAGTRETSCARFTAVTAEVVWWISPRMKSGWVDSKTVCRECVYSKRWGLSPPRWTQQMVCR